MSHNHRRAVHVTTVDRPVWDACWRLTRRVALVLVLSMCAVPPVTATPSDDERVRAITHELMSPYCPGLLLADCRSPGAVALREEIQQRVMAAESTASIEDTMAARFGESIRAVPSIHGNGAILWFFPGIAAAVSLGICVRALNSFTPGRSAFRHDLPPADVWVDDERIQDELDAID